MRTQVRDAMRHMLVVLVLAVVAVLEGCRSRPATEPQVGIPSVIHTTIGPYKLFVSDRRAVRLGAVPLVEVASHGARVTERYHVAGTDVQFIGDNLVLNGTEHAIPPGTKQISIVDGVLTFDGKPPTR
jgi:hypothetical protein